MRITLTLNLILLVAIATLFGCQSKTGSRAPSNTQYEFDSSKVQLLKWAAQNRIMFQIPETSFQDVASVQVQESCKKLKEPAWTETIFSTLEILKKNSSLQNKIHVIEVKKADAPKVEISKDLDGLTYAVLSYSMGEKKSTIIDVAQVPCENRTTLYLGEELTEKTFATPTTAAITKTIKELPVRTNPDRWNFNTDFLKHLATKMTILKFSPELGFERSADGQFFLVQFLNEQAQAIAKNQFTAFDYWLTEIAQRSHSGSYLKIMALIQDKQLNYGMGSNQENHGLAYPFLSYKSQDGKYTYTSMGQLNSCLEELSMKYKRGLASIRSDYSTQADSFLSPGHICHIENP